LVTATRGCFKGALEATADAIDTVQHMEDQCWNTALKAVKSGLLDLMPHHRQIYQ